MFKAVWNYIQRTVSPRHFYDIGGQWLPWLWVAAGLLLAAGSVWSLAIAPADYQQGNSYRIIFIHVPAASIAMGGYVLMAACGAVRSGTFSSRTSVSSVSAPPAPPCTVMRS